jgi:hypothetical protein
VGLGAVQAPRVRWDMPSTETGAQAPRVSTWFFFDINNSFLKFIIDNNNSSSSNF